jgi:hypothetical protein
MSTTSRVDPCSAITSTVSMGKNQRKEMADHEGKPTR